MNRKLIPLVALVLVVFSSVTAFADEVAELNEEGIAAFENERFEEAAQKFRAAWSIEPDPSLRKNEAIAWFKAGRCEEALVAASSYVGLGIDDPAAREDAESVIANCKVEFARDAMKVSDLDLAEKMLDEIEGLQVDEFTREQMNLARLDLARARDEARAEALPAEPERAPETDDDTLGWVLTGTGGVVFLTAVIYHLVMATSVASEHEEVGAAGEDRVRFDALSSQLDTARWLVPTLYVVGATTAGIGIYLILDSAVETPQASFSPDLGRVSPRTAAAGIRWRF